MNKLYIEISAALPLQHDDLAVYYDHSIVMCHVNGLRATANLDIDGVPAAHQIEIKKNVDHENVFLLKSISVDGVALPEWLLRDNSVFTWPDNQHPGSLQWHPAGSWHFDFCTPFLTWTLDQKIIHEARYNQDYLYPWSYKLGPDSVNLLGQKLNQTIRKVEQVL